MRIGAVALRACRGLAMSLLFCLVLCSGALPSAHAQLPETILHTFNAYSDGAYPDSSLIQGRDGAYYGTTGGGGTNGYGTVYQMNRDGSSFNILHSFSDVEGIDPIAGALQASDGKLYGTTYYGGANNEGAIYRLNTDGSDFSTLYSFGLSEGAQPIAGLIQGSDGNLYGATYYGGASGDGTVFQISPDGTVFNTLHSFGASDGSFPEGGVVQGSDGQLHGTTTYGIPGQSRNIGTIYTVSTSGSNFSTVFSFSDGIQDGLAPGYGSLVLGKDGSFYGTTTGGGAFGSNGILFKITPTGRLTILCNFDDGIYPTAVSPLVRTA